MPLSNGEVKLERWAANRSIILYGDAGSCFLVQYTDVTEYYCDSDRASLTYATRQLYMHPG